LSAIFLRKNVDITEKNLAKQKKQQQKLFTGFIRDSCKCFSDSHPQKECANK